MDAPVHGFSVPFEFPVVFTTGVFDVANRTFVDLVRRKEPARRHRVLFVVDDQVARAHPALLADIDGYFQAHAGGLSLAARPVVVPGGEQAKDGFVHSDALLRVVNDAGIDRQSFFAVIGGGAVLDMASYAAAIAHRSVRIVRLPTTVLSQGDSGIAVKNGVNLFGKKNFAGTFAPPFGVINDFRFLETLSPRDRISGVVEAIKVALLRDPAFYASMERDAADIAAGRSYVMNALVKRSAELHLTHICGNGDPFELGSARPLDFGHWSAHKLESLSRHRLRHGEAVAIGMALDVIYSVRMHYLDPVVGDRILNLLEGIGFRLWDDTLLARGSDGTLAVLGGLQEFREHLGGELHITLLADIGRGFEVSAMDERVVMAAIDALTERDAVRYPAAISTTPSAFR